MHCAESLVLPLENMHDQETKTYEENIPSGAFQVKTPGSHPCDIMHYVSAFSKRELTFPDDKFNAMEGIFHVFKRSPQPVHQIQGVPILPQIYQSRLSRPYLNIPRSVDKSFLVGLTWYHSSPGTRNYFFPSWSWVGWTGEVDPYLKFFSPWESSLEDTTVSIEQAFTGAPLPFPEIEYLASDDSHSPSHEELWGDQKFIHITAKTFSCSSIHESVWSSLDSVSRLAAPKGRYVRLPVEEGTSICVEVKLDKELGELELPEQKMTGILVGDVRKGRKIVVLSVEELNSQAERIGIGSFGDSSSVEIGDKWRPLQDEIFVKWANENLKQRTIMLG
jgi:hypothetical protein